MKEKENEKTVGCLAGIWTWPPQRPPAQKVRQQTTLIILNIFLCHLHCLTLMWSWIYHKVKNIHLRKNSLNEYFKAISHGHLMNMLIFSSSRWSLCHHSFSVLKIFHCEDFWPLFESGNMGTQNAWWRHAEWRLLEFVCGLLLGNCGYQTDRKKDLWPKQNRILLSLWSGRDKIINLLHCENYNLL